MDGNGMLAVTHSWVRIFDLCLYRIYLHHSSSVVQNHSPTRSPPIEKYSRIQATSIPNPILNPRDTPQYSKKKRDSSV